MSEACRAVGLNARGARRLHGHASAVYLLPSENAVLRLALGSLARCERAVAVCRWLLARGLRVTEPLAVEQPVAIGEWSVTFWRYYPQPQASPPDPSRLGELLRELHTMPAPPAALPPYRPLADLERTLASVTCIGEADRVWLRERRAELLTVYAGLDFPLGVGHIHGDAHPGNLLWDGPDVVLGDWDEVATGPRELDLVNTYHGVRFGRTEQELRRFAEAYGYDVTRWPGFPTLRAVRDLHTLGAYLRRADHGDEAARAQVLHRLETLRTGNENARWAIT